MYCAKCGKELVDDAKFCQYCGAEIEGIAEIEIKEEAAVTQTDKVQPKTEIKEQPKKEKVNKEKVFNEFLKIEKWATPIICLATMFVLLLCSFFIGVFVEESGIKQNTFHYFGDNFREVSTTFEGLGAEYQSQKSMLTFINVIACVVLALNLLVQVGFAALGGYKSFKTFKNGEKPDVFKYVLWMFISFIITATVIYSLEYAYARTEVFGMEIEVGSEMSGGSKAGLIIGAIFLFVVYAMQKAKEGKSLLSVKTLYKLGFIALALVFAAVTLSCIGKCVIKESMEEVDSGMTIYQEMNYSAAAYLSYLISLELGMSVVDVGLEFATVMVNLFAMAAIAVTFAKLFKAFMCDEEVDKVTFIAACASVVFSLINLIIACVLAGERGADMVGNVTVSAGRTIVPFIFSLLTVGAIIAHGFFNSNREKPAVNESGNQEERAVIEETPSQMEEQTAE